MLQNVFIYSLFNNCGNTQNLKSIDTFCKWHKVRYTTRGIFENKQLKYNVVFLLNIK